MNPNVRLDREALEAFCRKWRIRELSVFGSALRDDFEADSDVDFLVSFEPGTVLDISDWLDMKHELEVYCGRTVELVEKETLRNPWKKHESLKAREVLYFGGCC